jgi:hypothetical protein
MNRTIKLGMSVSIVLVAALAVGARYHERPQPRSTLERTTSSVNAPTRRGLVRVVERVSVDERRPLTTRPVEERAQAWLAANPPKPELRAALLGIAARADLVRRPLPSVAEDDAEAATVAAAHRERAEQQAQFRLELRAALRAMTPAERASLRASHVHIIQLARQMARRGNG